MDSDYYEGTGYGKVVMGKNYNVLVVGMTIYTRSENGLLFFIGIEVSCSYGHVLNLTFWYIFSRIICTICKNLITLFPL